MLITLAIKIPFGIAVVLLVNLGAIVGCLALVSVIGSPCGKTDNARPGSLGPYRWGRPTVLDRSEVE